MPMLELVGGSGGGVAGGVTRVEPEMWLSPLGRAPHPEAEEPRPGRCMRVISVGPATAHLASERRLPGGGVAVWQCT